MAQLIGTGPDQVPINGLLGDMAFQNKDSVEFSDGKGGLASLDITAIKQQINVAATDVFIYDTSKDSDGGAWRQRCQHTSWYNEELNTATRGSRREFPSVAVIVAESNRVTIHDGDDPNLPMWMVFNKDTSYMVNAAGAGRSVAAVEALNAKMVVPLKSGSNNGTIIIDFIIDFGFEINAGTRRYGVQHKIIADRNVNATSFINFDTVNTVVADSSHNDVAMTVLPNAPIDAATGLPIPTIAVATNGGVSILKDDGSVESYALSAIGGIDLGGIVVVSFDELKNLWISQSHRTGTFGANLKICPSPYSSTPVTVYGWSGYVGAPYLISYTFGGGAETIRHVVPTNSYNIATGFNYTVYGLCYISHNSQNRNNSMVANIKINHNTGWMPGDIKGAWLSDTTQETVVGAELVTNGTFDSNTSGWTLGGNGTATVSGGVLTLTKTGAVDVTLVQSINTVVGKSYTFSISVPTAQSNYLLTISNSNQSATLASTGYQATTGIITLSFVATTTTTVVNLQQGGGAGSVSTFDNASVRLADADRSANNKGLQVFGNITKTPVATGADLVAYSGFSASNYLLQPYNSSFDFGTGDFSVTGWFNVSSTSGSQYLFERCVSGDPNSKRIEAFVENGYVKWYAGNATLLGQAAIYASNWYQFTYVKRGGVYYGYLNGALVFANAKTQDHSDVGAPLLFGTRAWSVGSAPLSSGALAMWRISSTAPSAEQIAKMYNDEKVLFQDNAKATLYGTSDAVTALAYDEDTDLLHVGTSSGRSVFKGLRRIDNTTDAVGNAISAVNGLVVEE